MPLRILSPIHRSTRQIAEHLRSVTGDIGLGNPAGHLLTYLRSYGPCTPTELGEVFGYPPSTLTGLLDRLEERGLAVKEPNPDDRRSYWVDVTPEGRRTAAELAGRLERFEADVIERAGEDALEGFRRVMDAVGAVTGIHLRKGSDDGREGDGGTLRDELHGHGEEPGRDR